MKNIVTAKFLVPKEIAERVVELAEYFEKTSPYKTMPDLKIENVKHETTQLKYKSVVTVSFTADHLNAVNDFLKTMELNLKEDLLHYDIGIMGVQ